MCAVFHKWLLVCQIVAVLMLLAVTAETGAAPAAPTEVSIRWATATTAVMSWEQQSDATWVCVNGWDGGIGVFRQCEVTATGPHIMTLTPGHVSGLQYYDIVEWIGPPDARTLYGHYQSYALYRERMLLPFVLQ